MTHAGSVPRQRRRARRRRDRRRQARRSRPPRTCSSCGSARRTASAASASTPCSPSAASRTSTGTSIRRSGGTATRRRRSTTSRSTSPTMTGRNVLLMHDIKKATVEALPRDPRLDRRRERAPQGARTRRIRIIQSWELADERLPARARRLASRRRRPTRAQWPRLRRKRRCASVPPPTAHRGGAVVGWPLRGRPRFGFVNRIGRMSSRCSLSPSTSTRSTCPHDRDVIAGILDRSREVVRGRAPGGRARVPVRARGPREEADHRHVDDLRAARHQARAAHLLPRRERRALLGDARPLLRPPHAAHRLQLQRPDGDRRPDPAARVPPQREALGKSLSYVRFLFMRMHRAGSATRCSSELLPPLEADGTSKLWEALGRHFTGLTYQEADRLSKDNKEFIRALFPDDPIHPELLPDDVQASSARSAPRRRARREDAAPDRLRLRRAIDPFDGGPHFIAKTDDITLVQRRRTRSRSHGRRRTASDRGRSSASSRRARARSFRAIGARVTPDRQRRRSGLTDDARQRLGVEVGQKVWLSYG